MRIRKGIFFEWVLQEELEIALEPAKDLAEILEERDHIDLHDGRRPSIA